MENVILLIILVAALAYLLKKATSGSKAFSKGCKSCGCNEAGKADSPEG